MISAMADEPLYENDLPYYAYLAEMRSMAGLSGSPVFFYLDKARGNLPDGVDFVFFLFGVIRAHWNLEKDFGELAANDGVEFDFGLNKGEQLNTGIAIITPGEYVKNMLEDDMMRTSREMTIQRLNAENAPVFDSALEEEVFTEGVFQNALKKVSAKISAPAEEKKETSE
jgi:hypothetical protein